MMKIVGSRSISQRHRSTDTDLDPLPKCHGSATLLNSTIGHILAYCNFDTQPKSSFFSSEPDGRTHADAWRSHGAQQRRQHDDDEAGHDVHGRRRPRRPALARTGRSGPARQLARPGRWPRRRPNGRRRRPQQSHASGQSRDWRPTGGGGQPYAGHE
jgi:hypothetical protein